MKPPAANPPNTRNPKRAEANPYITHNPKGIMPQSPGLRGTSYLGAGSSRRNNPERVVPALRLVSVFLFALVLFWRAPVHVTAQTTPKEPGKIEAATNSAT